MKKIQVIRGFNDIFPQDSYKWQCLESIIKSVLSSYNYKEVRLPLLEKSELFHRSVGETSDIVSKETYDFQDRNGENLTLRPEGTAGCVRMVVENNLASRGQTQKIWYLGPMFRYERPQKGRYRQFYQLGVETYGYSGLGIDLEILSVCWQLFNRLGITEHVVLEINNLGSVENRKNYTQALLDYLKPYHNDLDEDSVKRLDNNPLRILDSKIESTQKILQNAPKLIDFIDDEVREDFEKTCDYLEKLGIKYKVNKNLVRGLDYYSGLVFEWTTDKLGAQSAICAGGRYDSLIANLGGDDNFAIGFAIGMERLLILLEELNLLPNENNDLDIFFILEAQSVQQSMPIVDLIRFNTNFKCDLDLKLGSFKSQFKKADKQKARLAVIIGEKELENNSVTIKFLQDGRDQVGVEVPLLEEFLYKELNI
ncbi:histidine--tRNA ligase [Francisella frigiditurris]|uniref:Histidine--tRNA ligase n=1 Tax=Francisella frigiditurris TaxID=1542390 RepID=A0A1J0KR87_9GAMM|nr:histidine--tRNA ligase [Francisella frigiditurris]APC96261.1 histidine--tRNA ligase [Francisella frigiditurris]